MYRVIKVTTGGPTTNPDNTGMQVVIQDDVTRDTVSAHMEIQTDQMHDQLAWQNVWCAKFGVSHPDNDFCGTGTRNTRAGEASRDASLSSTGVDVTRQGGNGKG